MEDTLVSSLVPPRIFCPRKIHLSRERAARIYEKRIQTDNPFLDISRDVEEIIFSHISPLKHDFGTVLILGNRVQNLTLKLKETFPSTDFFSACSVCKPSEKKGTSLQMTEEIWPFKESSFDLIVSAGTLHTLNDLPGALLQTRKCLKPDGLFVASFVGGNTLSTLRKTLYEVEAQFYDRAAARISPFIDPSMGTTLLQRAGFSVPLVTQDKKSVAFESIFHLAHALRFLGENNTLESTPPPVSRSFWQKVERALPRNDQNLVEDNFHILTLAGRAFHPNQQKSLNVSKASLHLLR
ncbi:MAG: methyltransferase domain-containing protein [bacterium]|nr:methyltransferase domain-containing protein [bacterium]